MAVSGAGPYQHGHVKSVVQYLSPLAERLYVGGHGAALTTLYEDYIHLLLRCSPSINSRLSQLIWDIFVAIMIVYGCVSIPLRIGFDLETSAAQVAIDAVIDVMFFVDMVLQFRTAFFADDGDVIAEPRDIAWRYIRGL